MSAATRTCPSCGSRGDGNFCARCGARLATEGGGRSCPSCGATCEADDLYCAECGAPVAARPAKPLRDRLPWILSGLALVAFAVAISLMIGESTGERAEGMPSTGGVIPSPGAEGGEAAGGGTGMGGLDPGSVDLSDMSGREAADRLFDRAMRTAASGDTANARFFARMGLQAYEGVPPTEVDADARFHVGMLALLAGDRDAARSAADAILSDVPGHLLGWILRGRVAEAAGDDGALAEARDGFRAAFDAERGAGRSGYDEHGRLIEEEAGELGLRP
ncbi:MAG: hypothetical protein ACOC9N_01165 [Gemmatimonadota bacterium]